MTNALTSTKTATLNAEQRKLCDHTADLIRKFERATIKGVVEIGVRLNKVKESVGHGNFGSWLQREVGWTTRTAQNYMNVAMKLGDRCETISHLPQATVYKLAALPDADRKDIVGLINDPENPPLGEIQGRLSALSAKRQQAKMAEQIAAKDALRSPAAKKAAATKLENQKKTDEKRAQMERDRAAKLQSDAARWVASMPPEMVAEITQASQNNAAYYVADAIFKALKNAAASVSVSKPTDEVIEDAEVIEELPLDQVA